MRLSELTIRLRRQRLTSTETARIEAVERRHTMSLEALSRPAQRRTIKGRLANR